MIRTATILAILLLSLCQEANAQRLTRRLDSLTTRLDSIIPQRRIAGKLDSLLNARAERKTKNYDTAYIQRPEQNWTVRARLNATHWKLRSIHHDGPSSVFGSDLRSTLSLGVGYKGFMLSFSLNPSKWIHKSSDKEYSVVSYGRKLGGEVFYHESKDFNATSTINGKDHDISEYVDKISMVNASGYYILNPKRFSYPAAFCQSYIQKRSAGSWILGIDAFHIKAHTENMPEVGLNETRATMFMFGVGGGYGYNLVLPHNWFVHISAVPTFVLAQHNTMTVDGNKSRMNYKFPELLTAGRASVMHSFDKYFIGISGTFHLNTIGNHTDLFMENLKWKCRAFIGMRV